jgi:hypothetical protein
MTTRLRITLGGRFRALALGAALLPAAAVAQITNGGFETGTLSGWTVGGTGHVEVLQATNFTPNITPPEGGRFALLSTGPGVIGGAVGDLDGNGVSDFDTASLSVSLTVTSVPVALSFTWAMLTSDASRAAQYDDFFKVTLNGSVAEARSVYKPGGNSPYNDSPAYTGTSTTVASSGLTNTSLFAQGTSGFQQACAVINTPGVYTLEFLVADQSDGNNDTGLLIDDVQFPSPCLSTLGQMSSTAGADLEAKLGSLTFTPTETRDVALSNTGTIAALVSNGNLTGDNPNVQTQLFLWADGTFERITSMVGGDAGRPSLTSNGRWIAFASTGDLTPGNPGNADRNWEIFRFDRTNFALQQITNTTICANTSPSIANDSTGRFTAFATTCPGQVSVGFNADGNSEVIVYDSTNVAFQGLETTSCSSVAPSIASTVTTGRYIFMVTNCAYPGISNADGNNEIVRWDRVNSVYLQITNTAATVVNDVPSASGNGLAVGFLSSGNFTGGNADGNLEVFRWRSTAPNYLQLTSSAATIAHTWVTAEDSARYFAAERLDTLAFSFDTLLIDANVPSSTTLASSPSWSFPAVALNGATPVVYFQSTGDFDGRNPDGNSELFVNNGGVVPRSSYCATPNLAIPNNNPTGVTSTLAVSDVAGIADLNLFLRIDHTAVRDLIVTLRHVDTGTSRILIDLPGIPATSTGCTGNDILATLDDEAASPVEDQCAGTAPTINGVFIPNNLLSAFDGESVAGTWELTVSDNRTSNTGTLIEWCLSVEGS